ncbi:MAG: hypothetical protein ABIR59_05800 [Gemmatimonadales bacterium]
MTHLTMEQLLAVRDDDRSEPEFAEAHSHVAACEACRGELDRLHQRTARLRALPTMSSAHNHFPAVRARWQWDRQQRRIRLVSGVCTAAAAALLLSVVGRDLLIPPRLNAEQQLQTAIDASQQLEATLHAWDPAQRVVDGRTAQLVVVIEDRIAEVDSRLQDIARLEHQERLRRQVELWRERVSLMNALVDVHVTQASNVDL